MATNVIEIIPENQLQRQDELPGRYPTVARVGDNNRKGNNAVFFDDTITILYKENVSSSFPTTLPAGSRYLSASISSNISITNGTVTKDGTEQFVVIPKQIETFVPYTEDRQFAQARTSFYLTGSDVSDVGIGFSTPLSSKTIIKIPIPIATALTFPTQSGANYYYNVTRQRFEQITSLAGPQGTPTTAGREPLSLNNSLLFTPLGIPYSRNFAGLVGTFQGTGIASNTGFDLEYDSSAGLLLSGVYAGTSSQIINASNYITKPFLVEKAVLELPFEAGSGWLNDTTMHGVFDQIFAFQTTTGGPAITFGLINQVATNRRDLILSGSIVPVGDTSTYFSHYWHTQSPQRLIRTLNGFTTWCTPACVISGTGNTFTGSARLIMHAEESNGRFYEFIDSASFKTTVSVNPIGRSMQGPSGRALFGGDFVLGRTLNDNTIPASWSQVPTPTDYSDVGLFSQNFYKKSPYLLHPSDKLLAYFSITAPIRSGSLVSSFASASFTGSLASHDVKIPAGVALLTLYGSQVAGNVEFHDTLNQRLETNQVHEAVDFSPVIDQFDVGYMQELSGTYIDKIVTGTMVYQVWPTNILTARRDLFGSNFSPASPTTPLDSRYFSEFAYGKHQISNKFRNVHLTSEVEQFFDSTYPSIDQISAVNSPTLPAVSYDSGVNGGATFLVNVALDSFQSNPALGAVDHIWTKSFPFEPRYSSLIRKYVAGGIEVNYILGEFVAPRRFTTKEVRVTTTELVAGTVTTVSYHEFDRHNNTAVGMLEKDLIKFYYGFGDRNTRYRTGSISFEFGTTNAPQFLTGTTTMGRHDRFGTIIRGWKYGLFSGIKTNTRAVYRRDHYGQPRDMLEQRLDTKFYTKELSKNGAYITNIASMINSPVQVRFVNSAGETTLPENTFSSNLSNEATSSLPYFDGNVRNREEPINQTNTNQAFVVV